jgi:hypothetical protein
MEGNQSSFPVVRVSEPLFFIEQGNEIWTKLGYDEKGNRRRPPDVQNRIDTLEIVYKGSEIRVLTKKAQTLWHRLRDQKAKELIDCAKHGDPQLKSIKLLAERFMQAAKVPETLLMKVVERAVARLRQDRLKAIDAVEQLMVGKGPPGKQGKSSAVTVQLAFDIEETEDHGPDVYSQRVISRLVEVLPQDPFWNRSSVCQEQSEGTEVDALTGEHANLEKKAFPKVGLPVPSGVGKENRIGRKPFPLASMFSEARCNRRYGMTDARVFPLAQARATRLKEALEEITADGRREKTWQHVASGRFDMQSGRKIEKPDLLIAYVEEKPMLDAKTAGFFGQGQSTTEAKFEVDAAVVCMAFRGIVHEIPHSKLNLFLIREASKGQAQVILAESPTVKEVLEAAERWQRAVRDNVPHVLMYLPAVTINNHKIPAIEEASPLAPYPDQVVRLLSHQWVRDGASPRGVSGKPQKANQEVIGPGLGEVLALMLRMDGKWEPAAKRMLDLLIRRVAPLLIGIFGAKHAFGPRHAEEKHEPLFDYPRASRETALRAVAVFGILLDALGSRKESYMKDAPYRVGQILAMADTLHKDYCIVVRKGQVPNSLIGTSLMRRALDSPAGALADLSERILEYIRWAKTVKMPEDWPKKDQRRIAVNEARKKLREYSPLAAALASLDLPTECDDLMKAQLLLGFLAASPNGEQDDQRKDEDCDEGR